MANFQQNEGPFSFISYDNFCYPLPDTTLVSANADESLFALQFEQHFLSGCSAAISDINLDPGDVSQLLSLPISQEQLSEIGPEASVTSLSSLGTGSFLFDIPTASTSPLKSSSSARFSAATLDIPTGLWASPNSIAYGMENEVSFVGAGLQWPADQSLPELLVSPAESIFPVGTEGSEVITDDDFVNGAFPSLDHFAVPMTTAHDPTTETSDRMMEQIQYPSESVAAEASPRAIYSCPKCPRRFPSKSAFGKHEKTHTRPFVCSICGAGHGAERDKNRHMWTRHPADAARLNIPVLLKQCPHCPMRARHDNLKRHIRTLHSDVAVGGRGRATRKQDT